MTLTLKVAAAVVAVIVVVLGYVSLVGRLNGLSDDMRSVRDAPITTPTVTKKSEGDNVIRSPRPRDLITVISGGSEYSQNEWPPCSGSNSICVDRVLAPCDEVELAYSYGHMMSHTRFRVFTVGRGAMVDHEGNALSPEDIIEMAEEEGAQFDGGPEATLDAARRGDRTRLVGAYTERGEIDVFHPAAIGLDVVRCTDRETRFEVLESD